MPTATHSIVAGAAIVDYELDPFDPTRVFVACEHSRIRSCRIPEGGLEEDWCEVEVAMVGQSRVLARLEGEELMPFRRFGDG